MHNTLKRMKMLHCQLSTIYVGINETGAFSVLSMPSW